MTATGGGAETGTRQEQQRQAQVLLPWAVSGCNRDNRYTTGKLLFRTSDRSK